MAAAPRWTTGPKSAARSAEWGCSPTLLYMVLPLVLVLIQAAPILALVARSTRRKSWGNPAGPREPAANNSLQPDAVHLIRNIARSDAEQGPRDDNGVAVKAGPPAGGHLPCGLPKMDISNEERAKLNQLNQAPALPRPLL